MSLIGDETFEEVNLRQLVRHMLGVDRGGILSRRFTPTEVAAIVNEEIKNAKELHGSFRGRTKVKEDCPSAPA